MAAAPEKFTVCHSLPSRLRVRVQDIRRREQGAAALEQWLDGQTGVMEATASPLTGSVTLHFDPAVVPMQTLFDRLEEGISQLPRLLKEAPLTPAGLEPRGEPAPGPALARVLGLTVFLGWHFISALFLAAPFSPPVLAGAAVIGALPLWRRGLTDILNLRFIGLNPLLGTAAVLAIATGETLTALEVIWILEIGELLEGYLADRSRRAIRELLQMAAKDTFVLVDGVEVETPVSRVRQGDVVVVQSMEKIPVDGTVAGGDALVNQAHITGRAEPELRRAGDPVFAGTIVQQGKIQVRAEKVGDATYLSQIVSLVESALKNRPQAEKQVEVLAGRLTRWGLMATAAALLLTWDLSRVIAVMLVMSCPCATVLAASTAVTAALANAADRLILIKGGLYLEQFGRTDVFCFDKTGTLTTDVPTVADVVAAPGGITPEKVLALAAAAEVRNPHPLARALVQAAGADSAAVPHAEAVPEIFLGRGVRARLGKAEVLVGNGAFMREQGVDSGALQVRARELEEAGRTVVYVARNGKVLGLISITYEAQDDLQDLIKTLRTDGVKQFHLISGDNARVVAALAGPLHFDGYRGNLRPEEKAVYVEELVALGHTVAFVGDGVNDAPALSKASVGVAMGAAGSEAAITAADIALADDNLMNLILVRRLSRQTVRVIHQNYWLALGTDLAGSVLALAGFLTPFLGGLLHIGHAAAIAANSGRLLTWQPGSKSG